MLARTRDIQRHALRRGALAIVVLSAHIGLVIWVAQSTTFARKPPAETPILVALVPAPPRIPERLALPPPTLAVSRSVPVPPPEFQLPADRSDVLSMGDPVVSTDQHPPAAASPPPAPGLNFQMMSTVAYVQRPAPAYPRESRLAREEGLVILRVLIDESGRARDIEVYRSSGHPRLDKEACAAVARALFKPYLDGGVARPAIAMVPIEFSLRSKSS